MKELFFVLVVAAVALGGTVLVFTADASDPPPATHNKYWVESWLMHDGEPTYPAETSGYAEFCVQENGVTPPKYAWKGRTTLTTDTDWEITFSPDQDETRYRWHSYLVTPPGLQPFDENSNHYYSDDRLSLRLNKHLWYGQGL